MKKLLTITTLFISCILLTGCFSSEYKYHSNYTNAEVISMAETYVLEELRDLKDLEFEYKIIDKKPLEVCTFSWNVCHETTTIKGAYEYTIEVINKKTGIAESKITVKDKYIKSGEVKSRKPSSVNFLTNRKFYTRYENLLKILENYKSIKYHFVDEVFEQYENGEINPELRTIQYGYLYSRNTEELENFLNRINKNQYEFYWDFMITQDINIYNSLVEQGKNYELELNKYTKTNKVYEVDLSEFKNNPSAIINNTSQGSSTCVNSVLVK